MNVGTKVMLLDYAGIDGLGGVIVGYNSFEDSYTVDVGAVEVEVLPSEMELVPEKLKDSVTFDELNDGPYEYEFTTDYNERVFKRTTDETFWLETEDGNIKQVFICYKVVRDVVVLE